MNWGKIIIFFSFISHSLSIAALPQFCNSDGTPKAVKVVGVVGIGHIFGIQKNWGDVDESQLKKILTVPPATVSARLFKYTLKYGLFVIIGFSVYKVVKRLQ